MSFTTIIKNELTNLTLTETEKTSFLAGFVRNNALLLEDELQLSSENKKIILYLSQLLDSFEGVKYYTSVNEGSNFREHKLQVLHINGRQDFLLKLFSFVEEVPDSYLVEDDEEKRAYLRGVFLTSGSINDPKTSRYHMELLLERAEEAVFVQKCLNQFDLNSKLLARDKGYMIYLKEAEKISDFLKIIGAVQAVLYFENVRIFREQKNQTNRLNNCEQANTDRVIETALSQLHYIKILKDLEAINLLDDKTKEALIYREKYPESSLKELSEIISLETGHIITKSGLNHRFRKIKEVALRVEKNANESL